MTDTDTAAKPAGKRARGGAAKTGGKAAKPLDNKAFLGMLTDAKKLVTEFQRALKQASPKLGMRDYMTLARLNAGETATAEAGDAGEAAGKAPKARKGATASLQHSGLVTTTAEGRPEVTDQGRKVLADVDGLLANVLAAMSGKKGAATTAGSRNVPRALKAVKKSTRAAGGEKPAGAKAERRARKKAGASQDATEPGATMQS